MGALFEEAATHGAHLLVDHVILVPVVGGGICPVFDLLQEFEVYADDTFMLIRRLRHIRYIIVVPILILEFAVAFLVACDMETHDFDGDHGEEDED